MVDEGHPDTDTEDSANVIPNAEVARMWARFREGEIVRCAKDEFALALAVDGAAKSYRLICTACGLSSPWFGTTPSGIVVRGPTSTIVPTGDAREE